jgi:hypothetical protein
MCLVVSVACRNIMLQESVVFCTGQLLLHSMARWLHVSLIQHMLDLQQP